MRAPSSERPLRDIARILGTVDTDVVDKVLAGESTQDHDLGKLEKLADRCRREAAAVLTQPVDPKTLEDAGAVHAGLPTISKILDEYETLRAIRDDFIRSIAISTDDLLRLQSGKEPESGGAQRVVVREDVLTPPGPTAPPIVPGSGKGIHAEFRERLTVLLCLLHDVGMNTKNKRQVEISIGPVREDMMRTLTYASVRVPALQRIVEICNEVGNRCFVWYRGDTEAVRFFGTKNKEEKLQYLAQHSEAGTDLEIRAGWEEELRTLLLSAPSASRHGIVRTILKTRGRRARWQTCLEELQEFRTEFPGRWPRKNTVLGRWLDKQRGKLRDRRLEEEQAAALRAMGVEPAKVASDKLFEDWLQELQEFREEHPGEWPHRTPLSNWLQKQRCKLRDGVLEEEQAAALRAMGVEPAEKRVSPQPFEYWLQELQEFRKEHPEEWPYQGTPLKKWLRRIRGKLRDGELEEEQTASLRAMGVKSAKKMGAPHKSFEYWLRELQEFRKEHPGEWPSRTPLSSWLQQQRGKLRDGELEEEQTASLRAIGVEPAKKGAPPRPFEEWMRELQEFREEHPGKWPSSNNTSLGTWLRWQRGKLRDGELEEEQTASLRAIGVEPAKKGAPPRPFEEWMRELQEFREEHPGDWPSSNTLLGAWLRRIRRKLCDGELAEDSEKALRALGVQPAKLTPPPAP